jgi:hypothetical protein
MTSLLLLAVISGDSLLHNGGYALVILAVLAVIWFIADHFTGEKPIGKIIRGILIFIAAIVAINFLLSLIDKQFIRW